MADAGKIMIMPKGAYDAGTSYEVLDLVTHKGNVWVAKRNVTGVEPNSENSADWFLMADLANYLPLSGGGSVVGSVYATSKSANSVVIGASNTLATATVRASSSGTHGVYSDTHGKWIASADSSGNVTLNGTATGNLPLSGGKITGTNDTPLVIDGKLQAFIRFLADGVGKGYLGFDADGKLLTKIGANGWTEVLHTGNRIELIGSASGLGKAIAYDTNVYKELYCELAYFGSAKVSFDIVIPNGGTYNSGHQTSTGVTGGSVYLTGNTIQTSNFYFEGISRSDDNITLTVYGKR